MINPGVLQYLEVTQNRKKAVETEKELSLRWKEIREGMDPRSQEQRISRSRVVNCQMILSHQVK